MRKGIRVMGALAAALMVLWLTAIPATAAVTCTFMGGTVTVTLEDDDFVGLRVNGTAIQYDPNDTGFVNCGAAETTTTDTINITGATDTFVFVDLSGGAFAPGATDEPMSASDEIEFAVDLGSTTDFDFLEIDGTTGDDDIVLGTSGINLNAAESDGIDADMTMANIEELDVFADTGADEMSSAGGSGTGGELATLQFLVFHGMQGNDTETGGGGRQFLDGGPGNDDLSAGGGNGDVVRGGPDNDSLDGGPGVSDSAEFDGAPGPVVANLATGTATGWGMDTLAGVESLFGSTFNDTLTGNGLDNALRGFDGDDTIAGGDGVDGVHGGFGDDTVDGGPGNDDDGFECDEFTGGAGVRGGFGNDRLAGGSGNDRLCGVDDNDILDGGPGDDVLDGGTEIDEANFASSGTGVAVALSVAGPQATGGAGTDRLVAVENLTGSPADDTLGGDSASNVIVGGGGVDTLSVASAFGPTFVNLDAGVTSGGTGIDSISAMRNVVGSSFGDDLFGDGTKNVLSGGAGNDSASGGGGNDRLRGQQGKDKLRGQGGNDRLVGGPQRDSCSGGAGKKDRASCERKTGIP